MKKSIFTWAIILTALSLGACRQKSGSGVIITEKREAGMFRSVDVAEGIRLEYRKGEPSIEVEADDNLVRYIKTQVRQGKLTVRLDKINVRNATMVVHISQPTLNELEASSAAKIICLDPLSDPESIKFKASSAASIEASADAPAISARASSASEILLRGRSRSIELDASSGAGIRARELMSETAKAEASSGSSIELHSSLALDARASSGSSVRYRGKPSNVKKHEGSGGSVSGLDD